MSQFDEMKVKELRAELKKRGLPVSGTKPVLITRLKAGKSAIKRKASRKPRKKKSRKVVKKSRKKKSAKRKSRKAVKKSRKKKSRKVVKKSRKKKSAKRKPSVKKSRVQDWAAMTKDEISKELKSMKVVEIRKSPKLKPFLKGKSRAKKQELIEHLTDVLSSGQAPPAAKPKGKRRSSKKGSRKMVKKSSKKVGPKKSTRKVSKKVSRKTSHKRGQWKIHFIPKFTRKKIQAQPKRLFVFGENDECFHTGQEWRKNGNIDESDPCFQDRTQAIIRGEPNAAPIITVSRHGVNNKNMEKLIKRDVDAILKDMKSGKYKVLVFSTRLVGTGVAKLHTTNRKLWQFLLKELARLKPGDNKNPPLNSSIETFKDWLKGKPIKRTTIASRKVHIPGRKVSIKHKSKPSVITPVPQDSNADIEKAIRKCLYGDTDILPKESGSEEPEIIDDEDDEEEEVDDLGV